MVLEIVWLAFLASAAIQFIYLLVVFGRFVFFYNILELLCSFKAITLPIDKNT